MAVHVASATAQERDQRDAGGFGQLHRQRRWRADRGDCRCSGHHRLLDQLEARATGKQQHALAPGQRALHQRGANELVHCIMAADVFTDSQQFAFRRKQPDGMHAAGFGKPGLRGPKRIGHDPEHGFPNYQVAGHATNTGTGGHGSDGSFAADTAARGRVEIAIQAVEFERQVGADRDTDDVAGRSAVPGLDDIAWLTQQAFAVQESDGQFGVMARRTHGDGHRPARAAVALGRGRTLLHETNLERLFDRNRVGAMHAAAIAQRVDLNLADRALHAAESTLSYFRAPLRASAASTVLESNMAMVIGPTPPGTGVIQEARSAALAYSTSPQSFPSAPRLMPTSMTMAPSRIHSPGMYAALPTAATTRSARSTSPRRSFVPV